MTSETALDELNVILFVHGFRGSKRSFAQLPADLERSVNCKLAERGCIMLVPIFPRIQCWQEVETATLDLCDYLRHLALGSSPDQVDPSMLAILSRTFAATASPTRTVRVVLVAHSMGGFVVADALGILMDPTHANHVPGIDDAIIPLGVITLDTPYFGLSNDVLANYTEPTAHALVFVAALASGAPFPTWVKVGLAAVTAVGGLVAAAPHIKLYREFLKPLFLASMESRVQRIRFMLCRDVPFKSYYSTAERPNEDRKCKFISVPTKLPLDVAQCFTAVDTMLFCPIGAHAHMVDRKAGESVYAPFLADIADEISDWLHARSSG
ncbi:hypothetical protein GGF32_010098 [Allomyces javanicus]|nr:hypothetical protein GGF32_010098 [Allomyces javanicus]